MQFFTRERLLENMRAYLEAMGEDVSAAQESELLRSKFFRSSLRRQGVPLSGSEIERIRINPFDIYQHISEREGIPLSWSQVQKSEKQVDGVRQIIAKSTELLKEYYPSGFDACSSANFILAAFIVPEFKIKSGTSSTSVGLSFLCMDESWTEYRCARIFLHECVHNALFIEDMVQGVFGDQYFLEDEGAQVISAIRKTPRNFDLAFHAAVVALELIRFSQRVHRAVSEADREALRTSALALTRAAQLQNNQQKPPLTANGEGILQELVQEVDSLTSEFSR